MVHRSGNEDKELTALTLQRKQQEADGARLAAEELKELQIEEEEEKVRWAIQVLKNYPEDDKKMMAKTKFRQFGTYRQGRVLLEEYDEAMESEPTSPGDPTTKMIEAQTDGGSRSTVEQIQRATCIFVSILQEDQLLIPLYKSVRNDPIIGPNKLRRYIRHYLEVFAEQLNKEAKDPIQFAACRLVEAKTRYAAQHLASGTVMNIQSPELGYQRDGAKEDSTDSSEEETGQRSDEIPELGDLKAFYLFLGNSNAYATLQANIHAFCTVHLEATAYIANYVETTSIPNLPSPVTGNSRRTWLRDAKNLVYSFLADYLRRFVSERVGLLGTPMRRYNRAQGIDLERLALRFITEVAFPLQHNILKALGLLDPPLRDGWTRIWCECTCGDQFFDDFKELNSGGVAALVQEMKESSVNTKVTVTRYRPGVKAQKYAIRVSTWMHHVSSMLLAMFPWHNQNSPGLVRYNTGNTAPTANTKKPSNPQQQLNTVHLMSCVHRRRDDPTLLQIDVHDIKSDRELFSLLKAKVSQRHNRFFRAFSCRSIQGIFFTKFLLETNDHVEIRDHNESCASRISTESYCDCLPPIHIVEPYLNAEYRCNIPCPPDTWPPIGSNKLLHMLKCPETIAEDYTWVLYRVPKRIAGKLSGAGDQPADGWGFYFQEGWDFDVPVTVSFFMLVLGSLVFAVCWTVLESDIQGAFGVSAYMITAWGLIVAFSMSQTGKAG